MAAGPRTLHDTLPRMSLGGWLALILSTSIDAAVLAAALFLGRRGSVLGRERLALGFVASCISCAAKAVLLVALTGTFFFAINLAYTDLVVLVPLAAVAVLLASRRIAVARGVRTFAWCALFLAPLGYYATCVERFHLVEERTTIPISTERAGRTQLRIAVLADIQGREVEPQMREAVAKAMAFEPHLILIPGDLIQRGAHEYDAAIPEFRELLAPLDAPLGVYFVYGNCDNEKHVPKVFEGTHVRLLENETVELRFDDRTIQLGGCGFDANDDDVSRFVHGFEARPGDDLRILVAHYPDQISHLSPDSRVDLLVAGHTHGGQVRIPFFGPPITLSGVPRAVAAGGYHVMNGRALYVSRGIGCERGLAPRLRLNCPPEVSLLTLETRP